MSATSTFLISKALQGVVDEDCLANQNEVSSINSTAFVESDIQLFIKKEEATYFYELTAIDLEKGIIEIVASSHAFNILIDSATLAELEARIVINAAKEVLRNVSLTKLLKVIKANQREFKYTLQIII